MIGHVRVEADYDERELNEVLSFNASIYVPLSHKEVLASSPDNSW